MGVSVALQHSAVEVNTHEHAAVGVTLVRPVGLLVAGSVDFSWRITDAHSGPPSLAEVLQSVGGGYTELFFMLTGPSTVVCFERRLRISSRSSWQVSLPDMSRPCHECGSEVAT